VTPHDVDDVDARQHVLKKAGRDHRGSLLKTAGASLASAL